MIPKGRARTVAAGAATLLSLAVSVPATAQERTASPIDQRLLAGLRWRNLGPFRGGRIASVTGTIGQPGVFYVGLPAGGVWKTTSAGATWFPVFDDVPNVSSVGAIEVAPSDPNVVYAGTGDIVTGGAINEGDGVYVSSDAGRTWRHSGLERSKQIPSMIVNPRDARVVLVAAQGDLHAKSDARGVYRTTDGGATWTKTLYVDDETGIERLARAFDVPDVIFALTVRHYQPPPPPAGAPTTNLPTTPPQDTSRTGTALYKSIDGGVTWREITGGGLPRLAGRMSVAVAMHTGAQRVYLIGNAGLYRSDDGGATWRQMAADDERIRNGQGGYNCGVYVDPSNPDIVYTVSTSSYVSTNGGATFTGFKGAPGGDDPQQLWIDPTNGQRMLMGLDQGAVVTLDGGRTWSSWFNQSTEQIYHLSIDSSVPAWIYASQQDAGAIRTRARGNLGAVTMLDWNPVPGWEWGTIVADPRDPNTVYASGSGILKIWYPSEQWINVSPSIDPATKLRTTTSQPIAFAPWNSAQLYAAFQSLWSTTDGGVHWTRVSGDLTVPGPVTLASTGTTGAVESLALSSVAAGTIWTGASTGRIKLSRDYGSAWSDVSVPDLPSAPRINVEVEASHFDAATAYVTYDYHYAGDNGAYVFRTRDFGKTWTRIITGLPTNAPGGSMGRIIRADPVRRGLLFLGSETQMYVSFDDGDRWQPLGVGNAVSSYRDIAIKESDLVAATYGRGLWMLDDISLLRQVTPSVATEAVHLFAPANVARLRRNVNADTPIPPEMPHALNPPDGVIVDYWLAQPARMVTLDVEDAAGNLVRRYTSAPQPPVPEAARPPHPNFWVATPEPLPTAAGAHRVSWDLRHDPPPAFRHSFEINANPGLTPASPEGALVLPGTYTLRLSADGRTVTQTVTVRPDPQSPASNAALRAQHDLQVRIMDAMRATAEGREQALAVRTLVQRAAGTNSAAELTAAVTAFGARIDTVAGVLDVGRARGRSSSDAPPNFVGVNAALVSQLNAQDLGDFAPTEPMLAAFARTCGELHAVLSSLARVRTTELTTVNAALSARGLAPARYTLPEVRAPRC